MRVVQVKTKAAAHIVVRDGSGRKLFEVDLTGVTVVVTTTDDEPIHVDPVAARSGAKI